jgi:hypothetical protein
MFCLLSNEHRLNLVLAGEKEEERSFRSSLCLRVSNLTKQHAGGGGLTAFVLIRQTYSLFRREKPAGSFITSLCCALYPPSYILLGPNLQYRFVNYLCRHVFHHSRWAI